MSAFGEAGVGDTGDVWKVVCDGDFWQRDQNVMFKHADTGVFLAASGQTFGRPIDGQMEIIGSQRADGTTKWRTQEVENRLTDWNVTPVLSSWKF